MYKRQPKDKPAPRAQAQKAGAHDGMTGDMDCDACHTSTSWKLSASAGKSGFDHDKTGFPLRGSHVQTACTGCHTGGRALMSTCDSCHRDPHQGRMDGQCYECHTAVAWADVQQLEQHRRTRMPLTGKHAIVECNACHKRQAERTFTDLPVDCYACHSTEYHASTTHPNHDGTDPKVQKAPFPRDCGQCHNPIGWTPAFASTATVMPRVQAAREHDPFFQLTTGSHRAFDCASCHPDTARPHAVRCDGCHLSSELRTQHRQPIAASVGQACLRCHVRGARR